MKKTSEFTDRDIKALEADTKIGILATINPDGLPHLTLITSMLAKEPRRLMFGQFSEGVSKKHVRQNPNAGFLIMTMDRGLWRGTARWTHALNEGEDYQRFNEQPMFRYNAYFGIHTVHYLDLVGTYGRESLPIARILPAELAARMAGFRVAPKESHPILNPWARGLLNGVASLKFLGYVGEDGFPVIIPLFSCRSADSRNLVFSPLAYPDELAAVPRDAPVAVFAMNMRMESILARGVFTGIVKKRGARIGRIVIHWVYNSLPPVPGQIYPPVELKPADTFE